MSDIITRAIGATLDIYIDITVFSACLGDTFLLCSDGLYNMVSNDDIASTIANMPINEAVEVLIQKALDKSANDYVSVILVKGEK
jgi:serine/threonine protein phosphatase PrpC